jgi:hypothetical protein
MINTLIIIIFIAVILYIIYKIYYRWSYIKNYELIKNELYYMMDIAYQFVWGEHIMTILDSNITIDNNIEIDLYTKYINLLMDSLSESHKLLLFKYYNKFNLLNICNIYFKNKLKSDVSIRIDKGM